MCLASNVCVYKTQVTTKAQKTQVIYIYKNIFNSFDIRMRLIFIFILLYTVFHLMTGRKHVQEKAFPQCHNKIPWSLLCSLFILAPFTLNLKRKNKYDWRCASNGCMQHSVIYRLVEKQPCRCYSSKSSVFWPQTVSELKMLDFQTVAGCAFLICYIYKNRVERSELMKHRRSERDENKQLILNV